MGSPQAAAPFRAYPAAMVGCSTGCSVDIWSGVVPATGCRESLLHSALLQRLRGDLRWAPAAPPPPSSCSHLGACTAVFHTFSSSFSHTAERHFCPLTVFILGCHQGGGGAQQCPVLGRLETAMPGAPTLAMATHHDKSPSRSFCLYELFLKALGFESTNITITK